MSQSAETQTLALPACLLLCNHSVAKNRGCYQLTGLTTRSCPCFSWMIWSVAVSAEQSTVSPRSISGMDEKYGGGQRCELRVESNESMKQALSPALVSTGTVVQVSPAFRLRLGISEHQTFYYWL